MGTFEPSGDFEAQMLEAAAPQLEVVVEDLRSTVESLVEFPGQRSLPVESSSQGPGRWRVELMGAVGVIEEFGGTYSSPKAPLRRGVESSGLEWA